MVFSAVCQSRTPLTSAGCGSSALHGIVPGGLSSRRGTLYFPRPYEGLVSEKGIFFTCTQKNISVIYYMKMTGFVDQVSESRYDVSVTVSVFD